MEELITNHSNNSIVYLQPGEYYNGSQSCYSHPHLNYSIGISISLVGVIANLFFMYMVYQIPTMRTVLNAYLVNLAVSDLLFLLWHLSIWVKYLTSALTMSEYCAMMYFSRFCQYVSLFTVVVLSIERYLAMCKPIFYRDSVIHSRQFMSATIVCIWLLSCALSVEAVVDCMSTTDSRNTFGRVLFLLAVFSAMMLVLVMYILIILAAKNSTRPVLTLKKERQIIRICLATALVHFLCLTPVLIHTILLMTEIDPAGDDYDLSHYVMCLGNISSFLLEINSAVNPFIYNILSSTYRQACRRALCCGQKSHRRGDGSGHYMSARTLSTRSASTALSPNSQDVCSM
ncbi:nociceptin receptor-like [Ptychodera flava]|uniref:nociceptin receptor-like n=1 Tax=Ptychodera flava TaxID=63121 RepID=UPI00396AA21D